MDSARCAIGSSHVGYVRHCENVTVATSRFVTWAQESGKPPKWRLSFESAVNAVSRAASIPFQVSAAEALVAASVLSVDFGNSCLHEVVT